MKRTWYWLGASLMLLAAGCSQPVVPAKPVETHTEAQEAARPSPGETQAAETESPYTPIADRRERESYSSSLQITLDDAEHSLAVEQDLTYYNRTGEPLEEIYFNLIPQAFQEEGGGTEMETVTVGGEEGALRQVEGTVYALSLPSPLPEEQSLEIRMEYQVQIPEIRNRFGYQEDVYNLGNFLVTPAVYGEDGWAVEPYVDLGDAFYTEIAGYEAVIQVPEGYTVAATGEKVGENTYRAQHVRDFAFCASKSWEQISGSWEDVEIQVYYGDNMDLTAARALDTAEKSLELYSGAFGKYPYPVLRIVMSGLTGGVSGMEYPGLILVNPEIGLEEYPDLDLENPAGTEASYTLVSWDNTVCHEIAHQWFYGIVGNDQIQEPWLDEGFCRYCEYLYQKAYPPQVAEDDGVYLMEDRLRDRHIQVSGEGGEAGISYALDTTDLDWSLYDWWEQDSMGYSEVYDKGASLLYQMELQMGEDAFGDAMKDYVQHFAYGVVSTKSFQEFWQSYGEFSQLFSQYLA